MKYLMIIIMALAFAGCSEEQWARVESSSMTVQNNAIKAAKAAHIIDPVTGGYGAMAGTAIGALGTLAGALAALAKARRARAIAQAASIAADQTSGGGKALVDAAKIVGVLEEIKNAYIKRG
jgi:hypothetical protein